MPHDWKTLLTTALPLSADDPLMPRLVELLSSIEAGARSFSQAATELDRDPLLQPVRDLVSLRDAEVTGNVTLGDIAGDKVVKITVNLPQPVLPTSADPLTIALLQLATLPIDHVPDPADLPPGSRMPLNRNPLFVGRETDLRLLAAALHAGGTAAIGQVAIAIGLGGIGKTQLASEFVYHYGQYFAGGVFWLNFSDAAAVTAEIIGCGLAGALDLPSGFKDMQLADQLRLVKEAWQSPLPRLLVFDNCEDEELLLQWRPSRGGTRVLVTGRRAVWDPLIGVTLLPLGVLARHESIALLRKLGLAQAPDRELDLIAAELGDLPLALHLAGSYLGRYRTAVSPHEYLAQLRSPDLLKHRSMQGEHMRAARSPTAHLLHVARTFALSYDKLDSTDSIDALAKSILLRVSHFAPGISIPRALLGVSISVAADIFDIDDALLRLTALGLLEVTSDDGLSLHRLLARFVQDTIVEDNAQSEVEQAIAERAKELNDLGVPARLLAIQPHLRHVTDAALLRQDVQAATLCQELANNLRLLGDYTAALAYVEHSLTIRQRVPAPNDADMARSLNDMGVMLQMLGNLTGARAYLEQALSIRRAVLGEQHPDTAQSLNNLGNLLQAQGDLVAARVYNEQALAIWRAVLGEQHPDTARSLNNLGNLLQAQGNLAAARVYNEQALAINRTVLGEQHPNTARSLNNLGNLLQAQGDLATARVYNEQALAIWRAVLGEQHPDTAASLNNLGSLLQDQGDLATARVYYEQALAINRAVLGEQHPNTARSLNNLGNLLQAQGDLVVARAYNEQALAINRAVLGERHPDTARSLNNLAVFYSNQRKWREALPLLRQALEIRLAVLGPDHPDTHSTPDNLAKVEKNLYPFTRRASSQKASPQQKSTQPVYRSPPTTSSKRRKRKK